MYTTILNPAMCIYDNALENNEIDIYVTCL